MSDEVTLGEVVRRLEQVTTQIAALVERLERRDHYMEENFVRQTVWNEARKADQGMVANLNQDIGALQKERDADVAYRRQVMLALAVLAISTFASIALAVANLR